MRAPKFNKEQVKQMVKMYKEENKIAPIAKKMDTTTATIVSYLTKEKVYTPRKIKRTKKVKTPESNASIRKGTVEEINSALEKARKEVVRLEKLLKTTVEKEEAKFKQIREKLNI